MNSSNAQPPKPIKASTAWIGFLLLFSTLLYAAYIAFWPSFQNNQLLKNGAQAEGVITDVQPTGNYINRQPEARITIQAHTTSTAGDGPLFMTQTVMAINPLFVPQFQVGKQVLIRYDKHNPARAAIEYTQP